MGSMGSMGSMMDHMQQMHGRFQDMGENGYWMHEGGMMPGSQHMMSLSGDLATMADAMHGAMGQMQSLMGQSGGGSSAYMPHLEQMQQHMKSMSEQLDAMAGIMPRLREGGAGEQPTGRMGSMGSMGSMMEHMDQMHMRFQNMGKEGYWMHGGGMMPGSQHMMSLSGDLGTLADAMRGAMDQMQSLMEQSGGENSAYMPHLEQMQEHMKSMSDQLDEMSRTMENLPNIPEK